MRRHELVSRRQVIEFAGPDLRRIERVRQQGQKQGGNNGADA